MLVPIPLDENVLGHPVDLAADQFEVAGLDRRQRASPQVEDAVGDRVAATPGDEVGRLGVILPLDLQGAGLPAVGQLHPPSGGHVVADLADGADRVLQRHVPHDDPGLDHAQHDVGGPDLEQHGHLAHVRVADDDVQPAEPLGVGMRLVAGVDDRAGSGGRAGHRLPDVLGTLAHAVDRAPRGLQHLARPADDLAGDQERHEDVGQPAELPVPADQVVLVTAVGVAGRVGVVLEQVDVAGDAFLAQPPLGLHQQAFEDALPRLVVGDEVEDVVALRGGVLGVAAHVEVEPGPVLEEHVAAASPGHDPAEQVPGDLVGREPPLTAEHARDPVLVLEPEDPPVHAYQPYVPVLTTGLAVGPRGRVAVPTGARVSIPSPDPKRGVPRLGRAAVNPHPGGGAARRPLPRHRTRRPPAPARGVPGQPRQQGLRRRVNLHRSHRAGRPRRARLPPAASPSSLSSAAPAMRRKARRGRLRSRTATSS